MLLSGLQVDLITNKSQTVYSLTSPSDHKIDFSILQEVSFNNIVHLKAFLCIKDADVVYATKSLNTFHDWFSMNFSCSESPKKCMCCCYL